MRVNELQSRNSRRSVASARAKGQPVSRLPVPYAEGILHGYSEMRIERVKQQDFRRLGDSRVKYLRLDSCVARLVLLLAGVTPLSLVSKISPLALVVRPALEVARRLGLVLEAHRLGELGAAPLDEL